MFEQRACYDVRVKRLRFQRSKYFQRTHLNFAKQFFLFFALLFCKSRLETTRANQIVCHSPFPKLHGSNVKCALSKRCCEQISSISAKSYLVHAGKTTHHINLTDKAYVKREGPES